MRRAQRSAVGQRIHDLRVRAGLSGRRLSKLASLSETHVAGIEGPRLLEHVRPQTLHALAEVLGTTMDYLAFGAGEPPSDRTLTIAVARAQRQFKLQLRAAG
jgi:transcriptional regulator with XRE-family HTH domain